MTDITPPVLVTLASGHIRGVGLRVVELSRELGVPVRAMVRLVNERSAQLRSLGAEVVADDLTKMEEVFPIVRGCRRIYLSISLSPQYVEVMAAAAGAARDLELIINMSIYNVSFTSPYEATKSPQHEEIFNQSSVPVTHPQPTLFFRIPLLWDLVAASIQDLGKIRLPFGRGRFAPINSNDMAEVTAKVSLDPAKYKEQILELTGTNSEDIKAIAGEYAAALCRPVEYKDIPLYTFHNKVLTSPALEIHTHTARHLRTLRKLYAANKFYFSSKAVKGILGQPATSIYNVIKDPSGGFPIASRTP
ncbi:putative nucleoside-diphosphate-sugar epimerase protein [Colletotrichum navitas]|uniref:Nucleoside-diphosphate-sugar epimerase protein n=1 Tax=Colletotrichum navitas TaxID=681940 RepID=A0AAD8UWE3_9PEZI|nr:putative nucleoside-diphosphate-sugar epimerase protein [Colletotrichum navitas]KAK1563964.1 putative nucleoside-diphosphate-sugar epimerase protein [Colletotrichum navitas]